MPDINFQSIVSGTNQQPYVQIMLDDKTAQLTPDEARSFALQLMIAAESAIGDAFLVHFMGGLVEGDTERAAHLGPLLSAFRDYRSNLRAKGDPLQWGELGEWPGETP